MINLTKLRTSTFLAGLLILISGCHSTQSKDTVKVGVIGGPEAALMNVAKKNALKNFGLNIVVIEYNNYKLPNEGLNKGEIDANMFQHQPYLDEVLKTEKYPLVAVGKTFVYPMGIYSKKYKKLTEVPKNAVVAIPNDPSNDARALLLLQRAKLIKLKPNTVPNVNTITYNPKKLKFKLLDADELTKALATVDLAVINTNYAIPDGLSPKKDAIFLEDAQSPYANLLVTRQENVNDPRIQKLLQAIRSPEVTEEADKLFNHEAIPAWK